MTTHFFGDTAVLTGRTMRHVTRSPDTIITTAIMPIAIMVLFVYVFGGAIDTGSVSYVNCMLPGILLITIASGISYTAFRLFNDMQGGIFERFQSMPIARPGVLWARMLSSLAANVISRAVVVGVAVGMGFRSGAGALAWLAVAGLLLLFTLALTWIAVIPGLTAKSVDGASAFSYPLIFLPFISSAFVPTGKMPGPVRAFADNQPVTSIVDTIRHLFDRLPGEQVPDRVDDRGHRLVVGEGADQAGHLPGRHERRADERQEDERVGERARPVHALRGEPGNDRDPGQRQREQQQQAGHREPGQHPGAGPEAHRQRHADDEHERDHVRRQRGQHVRPQHPRPGDRHRLEPLEDPALHVVEE